MLQITAKERTRRNGTESVNGSKYSFATLGFNNRQGKGVILKQLCELSCGVNPAPC